MLLTVTNTSILVADETLPFITFFLQIYYNRERERKQIRKRNKKRTK